MTDQEVEKLADLIVEKLIQRQERAIVVKSDSDIKAYARGKVIDRLLLLVRQSGGAGVTRSKIGRKFQQIIKSAEMGAILESLEADGLIVKSYRQESGVGRVSTVYHAP